VEKHKFRERQDSAGDKNKRGTDSRQNDKQATERDFPCQVVKFILIIITFDCKILMG
jgi:hypothetical protein